MAKIDTPIMILFFNRPDVLKDLFQWVRKVQPKDLFLVQDGPREGNPTDKEKILECQKVVENIDWECNVRRNYSPVNLTCDHREFTGIDWCFEQVDRLIILEDDCLPSVSFYDFCGELLEKYKDDERVHMISGFNRINHYADSPYDYVFSKTSAGIGWATWRRSWNAVRYINDNKVVENEEEYKYNNDRMNENTIKGNENLISVIEKSKALNQKLGRITSWEKLVGGAAELLSALTITPTKNLIKYNGITEDATHCYSDTMLLTKKVRKMLTQGAYELETPIKHPPYVLRDKAFEELDRKAFLQKSKLLKKFELFLNVIKAGRADILVDKIKKKIVKK